MAGLTVFLLAASCVQSPGLEPAPRAGAARAGLTADNGISANGLLLNGISANGISANGISANGLLLNGISANGISANGVPVSTDGLDGLYINGIGKNGVGVDGIGENAIVDEGVGENGLIIAGVGLRATGPDTIGTGGDGVSGMDLEGMSINGFYIHGTGDNGVVVDGVGLRDVGLDGLVINGPGMGSVRVYGMSDTGVALMDFTPAQEDAFEIALYHLVGCALDDGSSVTITAADGTPKTYEGLRGLAPEWQSGRLTQEGEERVRACLESAPDATIGLALNSEQEHNLDKLLRYMVECALGDTQTATIYAADGTPVAYQGAMGLAPEWIDEPLSAGGQQAVSACLAARTNALEQPVVLSLRGAGLATTEVEEALYSTHEGAFWGNLFAADPYIETCVVEGGGLSGRVCAEGDCGFTDMGDCAQTCASQDADDGHVFDCNGHGLVVNSFLSLGRRLHAGELLNSCMVAHNGTLWCWGQNTHGQVGDGTTIDREDPTEVSDLEGVVAEVTLGRAHTCARQRDGSMWCWGANDSGQLGTGTTTEHHRPVQVADLGWDVATVHTGSAHTCAVKTDGTVWCWGANDAGQLGTGATAGHTPTPAQVTGIGASVARLSASIKARHTCAVTSDGGLWCWGANDHGQLGDGTYQSRPQPVAVDEDADALPFGEVTDVCSTDDTTCARKVDGTLWCWGERYGALPVSLPVSARVAPGGLACGGEHVCAVAEDSTVWCQGENDHGQLGRDTGGEPSYDFQPVAGVDAISVVIAAEEYTCAMRVDRTLWCWGTDPGLFPTSLSIAPREVSWTLCNDGLCTGDESAQACPADC